MRAALLGICLSIAAFAPGAGAQCELGDFAVAAGSNENLVSAALSGSTAAVSGYGPFAYVFEPGATGWEAVQIAGGYVLFGALSVAISGDTAIVGSPEDTVEGGLSGSVFVYERRPSGWVRTQRLRPSDAQPENFFGASVALEGDRLIVGSTHWFISAGDVDAAFYEFERVGTSWVETEKFQATSPWTYDFGASCALAGDVLVAGNPNDNHAGSASGSAIVFERAFLGGWAETARLVASDAAAQNTFGRGVAVDGDRILVSARRGGATPTSRAYAFESTPQGWVETGLLDAAGPVSPGYRPPVALHGDRALVGFMGGARLYAADATGWSTTMTIDAPDGATSFGSGLALGDAIAIVTTASPGAAWAFDVDGVGTNYCAALPNSTGSPALISADGCGAVSAGDFVLRAAPVPNTPGLFFYGQIQIQTPFGNGFRCVTGATTRSPFVFGTGNASAWAPDLNAPPHNQLTPGSTWSFQAWFRDSAAGGSQFNLSDGLSVTFAP